MIIKPRLAYGDNFRMLCQLHEIVGGHIEFFMRIVRMGANRTIDAFVFLGECEDRIELAHTR
ncbi:hypothetical protein D3C72_2406190 [compost metagenome]